MYKEPLNLQYNDLLLRALLKTYYKVFFTKQQSSTFFFPLWSHRNVSFCYAIFTIASFWIEIRGIQINKMYTKMGPCFALKHLILMCDITNNYSFSLGMNIKK